MNPSYLNQILSYPQRESLISECPALALLCYQELVAAFRKGKRIADPLSLRDDVTVLLSIGSLHELTDRIFSATPHESDLPPLWCTLRKALECAWDPRGDGERQCELTMVGGKLRFYKKKCDRMPLAQSSMRNALNMSRTRIREVIACALSGSLEPLGGRRNEPIAALLQFSRLIPPPSEERVVTSEGLAFCMQPLQQQWWTLVSVVLDRALAIMSGKGVSRATLWQLLAVLFALNTSDYVYLFPSKDDDLEAFQLLARLSEVGLVYPLICNGEKCFVLSPHFHHAICWSSTPSLCTAALLDDTRGPSSRLRREDEDTIITETNFRLYAYTKNPDMLRILDQFAVKEVDVVGMVVCYRVTRASFASALAKGIGANHILQFLTVKAHPSMIKQSNSEAGDPSCPVLPAASAGFGNTSEYRQGNIIPQSFCDQLFTWERECRRLIFRHDVVLLKNIGKEQMEIILNCLSNSGEQHAVVHRESGTLVIEQEVYTRVLSNFITPD